MHNETLNPAQCTVDLSVFTHSHSTNRVSFLTCFPDIHICTYSLPFSAAYLRVFVRAAVNVAFFALDIYLYLTLYVHHDYRLYVYVWTLVLFSITCICYLPKAKLFGASESVTNILQIYCYSFDV